MNQFYFHLDRLAHHAEIPETGDKCGVTCTVCAWGYDYDQGLS